ncbi:MAG: signal peptidase I [Chitinophagaceae bacterium]|nr:MAG: signal peptidase I [Bacteroidetes bacterium OLB11]MCC6447359.1 signal peptidase I [Chitinophagaceae bacterium]
MNIPYISKKNTENDKPKPKKGILREWLDAAVFAIVAATIIRTFFIEAYTIPTPSMEKSLLVNDYLFVSKMHYGARLPMTPLAVPFVHNVMPIFGGKSYTTAVQWKYHRLWGFSKVERYDDVVFNFPEGDTVFVETSNPTYYDLVRYGRWDKTVHPYITHPVDKTDNYIKRCVGIAGDIIEIKEGVLYVNHQPAKSFRFVQQEYFVKVNNGYLNTDDLNSIGILNDDIRQIAPNVYIVNTIKENIEIIKKYQNVTEVEQVILKKEEFGKTVGEICFPHDTTHFNWTKDNFGPLTIPKKGETVQLNLDNIALYQRLIETYEKHKLEIKDQTIFIDGQAATSYTFGMDYFWMMGDNRHNSLDSRFWGFVPEDHVVGKAWFIWMSYDNNGIRWKRLLHSVKSLEN